MSRTSGGESFTIASTLSRRERVYQFSISSPSPAVRSLTSSTSACSAAWSCARISSARL